MFVDDNLLKILLILYVISKWHVKTARPISSDPYLRKSIFIFNAV
jgi:hypothetical protein